MSEIVLSPEQQQAHDAIVDFVKSKKPVLRVGGYAGTGKTTLIAEMIKTLREEDETLRISFCCFTGKAAFVLKTKLEAAEVLESEYVGTIHGLIYKPIIYQGLVVGWKRNDDLESDLIVVDEASMVSETIWNDLLSYKVPILAVGDHGQLPPIGDQMSLMENPNLTLTKIHRQAEGNPIIKLSVLAREDGHIPAGEWYGEKDGYVKKMILSVAKTCEGIKEFKDTLFLCGYNRTRTTVNLIMRRRYGFTKWAPMPGERLICLKNNREHGIFNGMGGKLEIIKEDPKWPYHYFCFITMDDETTYTGSVVKSQFGSQATLKEHPHLDPKQVKDLFDFGYCLTVHKAQGSEAENVVLFEERFPMMTDQDWRRWLYTGVTRARKKLLLVQGPRSKN
jgi:exodeoxyribonuclease V